MEQVGDFLGQHPLFAGLTSQLRRWLAGRLRDVRVPAGDWLFRSGDEADTVYFVLSGRLEMVRDTPGGPVVVGAASRGDNLGTVGLLTGEAHIESARAVRDSELAALERGYFVSLARESRSFSAGLLGSLGQALLESARPALPARRGPTVVAIVAPSPAERLEAVRARLVHELGAVLLDGAGEDVADDELARGLEHLERSRSTVVLDALAARSPNRLGFCVRQADSVLVLAGRAPPPEPLPAAAGLLGSELVWTAPPSRAIRARWLSALRPRAQHHLTGPSELDAGVAALARRLRGTSVGLVLSGGGARGLAHLGVARGLLDAGVRVDRYGGTSIGALVGALLALGLSPEDGRRLLAAEFAGRRPFHDFTIPVSSLARGRRALAMLARLFGDINIEELPHDFFCVSADLVTGEQFVHRRGDVVSAVAASMSIPGWAPPRPMGDRLLADGGLVNNFPTDVMAATGEGPVIGVDAMGMTRLGVADWSQPNIVDILTGAATLGSRRDAARNRSAGGITIRPDVASVGLLDFAQLDAMFSIGRQAVASLDESLDELVGDGSAP